MLHIVAHMDQIPRARLHDPHRRQRLLKIHVGGVGTLPQAVQHQHVDAADLRQGLLRNRDAVGDVGRAASLRLEEVAVRAGATVLNRQRRHLHVADPKGARDGFEGDHRTVQPQRIRLRGDVREHPVQRLDRLRRGIAVHHLLPVEGVEPAHIVESRHMIHMRMRDHNGVHLGDAQLQTGDPHLRRGVHQKRRLASLHIETRPAPLVAHVGRGAGRTLAADLGNPHARASAEELKR